MHDAEVLERRTAEAVELKRVVLLDYARAGREAPKALLRQPAQAHGIQAHEHMLFAALSALITSSGKDVRDARRLLRACALEGDEARARVT